MAWDEGPTIEDQIRADDKLSPVEKKLLIQQSRIEFFRGALLLAPLIILMAIIADFVKGWIGDLIACAVFFGGVITYRSIENKKRSVEIALAEESENRKKIKSLNKRRG